MDNENKELNEMLKRGMEDLEKNGSEIDEKVENEKQKLIDSRYQRRKAVRSLDVRP